MKTKEEILIEISNDMNIFIVRHGCRYELFATEERAQNLADQIIDREIANGTFNYPIILKERIK